VYRPILLGIAILSTTTLIAQNANPPVTSRAEEIQAQRMDKATHLTPDVPTKTEKGFVRTQKVLFRSPIRIGVGGLGPGAGFTIGAEPTWYSRGDQVVTRLFGSVTTLKFYHVGTGVDFPRLTYSGLGIGLEASHRDAPQLQYYGSGPNSSLSPRTQYRREDTFFTFRVGLREHYRLTPSCAITEDLLNVGPGTSSKFAQVSDVFTPAEAPGINVQSNYLIAGCALQVDFRDRPYDPRKGTFAAADYARYNAQDFSIFSFHRVSAVAEQYIPFLNDKRVIALRARTVFSPHSDSQVVPFYQQTILGGYDTLRGFRLYRFYDENSLLFNAEYRYEISTGFDMALFFDAGNVFHRPGDITLNGLHKDAGFGFRFKNRDSTIARLDAGFSNEGFHVWLKFGKLF
jgi:hypothetical protein